MRNRQTKQIFAALFIFLVLFTQQMTVHAKPQYSTSANGSQPQVSTPAPDALEQTRGRPPLSLTLALLGMCCVLGLVVGVFVLGFVVRTGNKKEWEANKNADTPDELH